MFANAAGPVMVIYLLAMGLPRTEFIILSPPRQALVSANSQTIK